MKKQLLGYVAVVLALVGAVMAIPAPPVATAGGHCGSCVTTYTQPEYIYVDRVLPVAYPVPFTVAVPVVSYNFNGGYGVPGYSPVFAAQPAAPAGVVQQPMVQQPKPGDPNAPRTSALFQLTDAELDYLIDRIEKRLQARAGTNSVGTTPAVQRPTSPPPPVPQDQPPQSKAVSDADVIRVLSTKNGQKSCADCHTSPNHKGGMIIFTSPNVLNPNANWKKIWDAADAGRMPKEAQTNKQALMSDADVDVLRDKMLASGSR